MTIIPERETPGDAGAAKPLPMPTDALGDAVQRHSAKLGQHLDRYLAAVARELQDRGVITGTPQRTDPAQRLLGSIVLDCTALRVAAWEPIDHHPTRLSLGGAIHPARPIPVVLTWDESIGWCAGLHHGPTSSSRRYLAGLLPTPDTVADFVVGLALGQPLGTAHPDDTPTPARPPLRLVQSPR